MALLDRESMYVKNNVYEATFLAFDNGKSGKSVRLRVSVCVRVSNKAEGAGRRILATLAS